MILCDNQAGSSALFPYLQRMTTDVILTRIDPPFADCAWIGNGPDEQQQLRVGVEYKTLDDVLKCIDDGRFAGHQVDGLVEYYDRRYLVWEAHIRVDRETGGIQEYSWRKKEWEYVYHNRQVLSSRDIDHWMTTIEEQAQFRTVWCRDKYESARWIANKHSWYTAKGWNDHTALKQFHVPPPPTASFETPSLLRRWVKELDGFRWERALAAEKVFRTPLEMALADEATWRKVDGVGPKLSTSAVKEIRDVWVPRSSRTRR